MRTTPATPNDVRRARSLFRRRLSRACQAMLLAIAIHLLQLRRVEAEDRADLKFYYYGEENNRVTAWGPAFLIEKDLDSRFQLKIEGVYDIISGATPTGIPAPSQIIRLPGMASSSASIVSGPSSRSTTTTTTGATTTPAGPPGAPSLDSKLPTQTFWDARFGVNAELRYRTGDYLFSGQVAASTEQDYTSIGGTLKASREFNQKNTVVSTGVSYIHDDVDILNPVSSEEKQTIQTMLGVTQILDPKTVLNANFVAGWSWGYLSDPYKSALVNGTVQPDTRPGSKNVQIFYTSLTRSIDSLNASVEGSYRFYRDSFGVTANTLSLGWYQKIGPSLVLKPSIRYYVQDNADFYAVQFFGMPQYYSADYRLSSLASISYGIKAIWTPKEKVSFDVGYERYNMRGRDGYTSSQAYPTTNIVTAGVSFRF